MQIHTEAFQGVKILKPSGCNVDLDVEVKRREEFVSNVPLDNLPGFGSQSKC